MSDNLKIPDMVCYWIDVLGLKGWTITTEAISIESVAYADDVPVYDRYFVGVEIDREKMKACIYHDCPLNKEYIVHELIHVKYPEWSEDQVNKETERLINQKKMNEKELQKIIEKLNNLDQLVLPNGATGAVWLEDVIDILNQNKEDE